MRVTSAPFSLARASIQPLAWVEGDPLAPRGPLPEQLPEWDAAVDLRVHRQLTVHPHVLAEETGLAPGSRMRITSGWYCTATRTREVGDTHSFELPQHGSADPFTHTSTLKLVGRSLAQSVLLESRLVLVEAAAGSLRTAAQLPGSVLWYQAQNLELEDSHSRFPMEWADFRSSIHDEQAAWALDWDPHDLDASTLGSVRLLLNQRHPRTANLLREDPPTESAQLLWDTIRFDVARQLIEGALSNEEFVRNPHAYDDGSIGATVRRMMSVHFPFHSTSTLQALARRSRAQFETLLQANLRLYGKYK